MIIQQDLNGNIRGKFASLAEASDKTGTKAGDIKRVLQGERNSAGGYVWKKSTEEITKIDLSVIPKGMKVEMFLEAYKAIKEAESKSKIQKVRINKNLPKPYLKGNPDNVLVIGDLHAPFVLDGYLEFCREQQEKFNCGTVVAIGDLIDGHSWSYHEPDVDGMGQGEEVNKAQEQLQDWFSVFPTAKCTLGNHDLLIARKARTIGLSSKFLKDFGAIWNAPKTWEFGHEFIINGVKYIHGTTGNAIKVAKDTRVSTVQGHLHTQGFVEYSVSDKDCIFGLQVGCGLDRQAYAFEYAKPFSKKPVIGCAVVLDKGTLPINLLMKL